MNSVTSEAEGFHLGGKGIRKRGWTEKEGYGGRLGYQMRGRTHPKIKAQRSVQ
jgi:hypothetical protein